MRKPTMWLFNTTNTNRAVQAQKMARGWKFFNLESRGSVLLKGLISFAITMKLVCAFVFAYAKCWFYHDTAHLN